MSSYRKRAFPIGFLLLIGPVGVAGDDTSVEDDTGHIEEVVVTGTWIPGTPEDDPLPVTSIDREALAAEGSPSVIELVRNLSFSQGADGESDQHGSRTGADRATVNLRGLSPSRSLVLLNSRRLPWSPGSVPDQAQLVVDVNLLPMAALERLEVLRDGATATYGSDAVAGVVNFITRSDFEGIELEQRASSLRRTPGGGDRRAQLDDVAVLSAQRGHRSGSPHSRRAIRRSSIWHPGTPTSTATTPTATRPIAGGRETVPNRTPPAYRPNGRPSPGSTVATSVRTDRRAGIRATPPSGEPSSKPNGTGGTRTGTPPSPTPDLADWRKTGLDCTIAACVRCLVSAATTASRWSRIDSTQTAISVSIGGRCAIMPAEDHAATGPRSPTPCPHIPMYRAPATRTTIRHSISRISPATCSPTGASRAGPPWSQSTRWCAATYLGNSPVAGPPTRRRAGPPRKLFSTRVHRGNRAQGRRTAGPRPLPLPGQPHD